jgi:hypothetical protein
MTALTNTLDKLHQLESLYRHGYQSAVVDQTLDKIIALEHAQALQELRTIEESLTKFEQEYRMASPDFFNRFQSGDLGDAVDYFEWSALYGMAETLRQRLQTLEIAA